MRIYLIEQTSLDGYRGAVVMGRSPEEALKILQTGYGIEHWDDPEIIYLGQASENILRLNRKSILLIDNTGDEP